ncbi:hypothetical protein [Streptomyces sp. NP160]|uniref:hypothetical protein n=1 Tax=Streptomyces sp. NP160 TaxID=2586637 RepID=UPI001C5A44A5|nr:hypothetical protein [Streptomyces sp. NP160]
MHRGGAASVEDLGWNSWRWDGTQAYCDSKLLVTALALARRWPQVVTSAIDPAWVPTRIGGAAAPDDLAEGHRTRV